MHTLTLPGSKSITNRDLILAALTEEKVILSGILKSDDTHFMIEALKKIGIQIEKSGNTLSIQGGIHKLHGSDEALFLRASGTCMRFLSALCALNTKDSITLTGKERLLERPMGELINALKNLGASVESNGDFPPLTIAGILTKNSKEISFLQQKENNYCHSKSCKETPKNIYFSSLSEAEKREISQFEFQKISLDGSISSQYFTALLHIAPLLPNGLHLIVENELVSKPYIDITINEMKKFGVNVKNNNYKEFFVAPQKYQASKIFSNKNQKFSKTSNLRKKNSELFRIFVEGDASALSYIANFIVLHGGEITIDNLGNNTKQGDYKYLDMLKIFGLTHHSNGQETSLKSSGIRHQNLSAYKNMSFDFEDMPDVSLSFMTLCLFLGGENKITGLKTLNLKECHRIDAMHQELKKLEVKVKSDNDSISIGELDSWGEKEKKNFQKQENNCCHSEESISKSYKNNFKKEISSAVKIDTYDDHRIAMSFGILGSFIGNLDIVDKACVEKTYPRFWEDLAWMQKNIGKK